MAKRSVPILALCAALLALPARSGGRPAVQLDPTDRTRLAEYFRLSADLGERLWRGWRDAPQAVLLVTYENEFLVRHPRPSPDFELLGHDPLLQSDVYTRKTKERADLLATWPAVGGVPTIVVGQAQKTTARTSTPWVVSLLHEHFHQMQMADPGYPRAVNELGLARGDRTGKWMLDYPFPYEDPELNTRFAALSRALSSALTAPDGSLSARAAEYRRERAALAGRLGRDDFAYLSFQLWQEGVARYTEYAISSLAAERYSPTPAFTALPDYMTFGQIASAVRAHVEGELARLSVAATKRIAFYYLGAGEAMLLDRLRVGWRERYFEERCTLDSNWK